MIKSSRNLAYASSVGLSWRVQIVTRLNHSNPNYTHSSALLDIFFWHNDKDVIEHILCYLISQFPLYISSSLWKLIDMPWINFDVICCVRLSQINLEARMVNNSTVILLLIYVFMVSNGISPFSNEAIPRSLFRVNITVLNSSWRHCMEHFSNY